MLSLFSLKSVGEKEKEPIIDAKLFLWYKTNSSGIY